MIQRAVTSSHEPPTVTTRPILLVEDNDLDLELARYAFREAGWIDGVHIVRDGDEALDYLYRRGDYTGRQGGQPEIMLLDLNMPRVDGLQVLQHVKSDPQLQGIHVIMFSTASDAHQQTRARGLGADDYVVKPPTVPALVTYIRTLCKSWFGRTSHG